MLFDVLLFGGAVPASNALVIAGLERIAVLECSKERWWLYIWLLFWEASVGSVCCVVRVECSSLTDGVAPGLVSVKYSAVLHCVLIALHVLLSLVWVL